MSTRHQLTLKVLPRYLKAARKEKGKILDEYCANTGYNRKYAIWKLNKNMNKLSAAQKQNSYLPSKKRYSPWFHNKKR